MCLQVRRLLQRPMPRPGLQAPLPCATPRPRLPCAAPQPWCAAGTLFVGAGTLWVLACRHPGRARKKGRVHPVSLQHSALPCHHAEHPSHTGFRCGTEIAALELAYEGAAVAACGCRLLVSLVPGWLLADSLPHPACSQSLTPPCFRPALGASQAASPTSPTSACAAWRRSATGRPAGAGAACSRNCAVPVESL